MYYYSNNYSKYIENLKLEKSRIAFQKLVEDSRENKNPDIRIKEVVSSKDSDSITKEFGIASKDNDSLSYEGELPEKSRNKIDSENVVKSKKSTNKISVDDSLSSKSGDEINNESLFSDIEPNDVEYNINESEKLYSAITGENEQSSKNEQDVSTEGALSDKFGNNINIEEQNSNKTENELNEIHPGSSKARTNLNKQNTFNSKSNSNLLKENPLSSKTTSDIIKDIKNEKKKAGMFADVITDSKKESNLILERGYQYFLIDPKDYESMMYEKNARHGYYPAGSYSEIDSNQKGAIDDLVGTISNDNNWNGGGNTIVSSIKAATDIVDMVNLVGPAKNIGYKNESANKHRWTLDTANNLRWDLRIDSEYSSDKKNDDFSEYHQRQNDGGYSIVNGFDGGEKKDDDETTIPKKNSKKYSLNVERLEYEYKQKVEGNNEKSGNKSISFKHIKGRKTFESNISREAFINSLRRNYEIIRLEKIDGEYPGDDYEDIELISDGEFGSEYGISVDNRKDKKDFSAEVVVLKNGQHPGNYEQKGDTQYHEAVKTENVAEIESSKDDSALVHDGPPKENGDLDIDFLEKSSDITDKDGKPYITGNIEINGNQLGVDNFSVLENKKEDVPKTFKYKVPKTNEDYPTDNIADASYGFTEQDRWYDRPNSIGKIYVMPPYQELKDSGNLTEDYGGNIPFSIPLQNNLSFEQISRAATWNAIQFFGRIGDVQQYSKTGNLEAINLTTKYFVETDGSDNSVFTMSRLQDIEMMYRSLVLPASVSANYLYDESNGYYYFTRPPIINVVLGNPGFIDNGNVNLEDSEYIEHAELPYHNLFTDIYTTRSDNGELNNQIYYKNFVVTNVTIDKNLNDYNYYIGEKENGKEERHYYDTTGFTVTLTLLEIDENYLGSLPSFNNYNYTLQSRQAIQ